MAGDLAGYCDGLIEPVVSLDIRGHLPPLHRAMMRLGASQIPFATSLALNTLARGVSADQEYLIGETFKTPTPFTKKAYRIEVATKTRLVSRVAAKDIQSQYLAPYVVGGTRFLGRKRGMLAPRGVMLNQYGNLTKGKLASLKAKPKTYIGKVKTRSGKEINGVWQRPSSAQRRRGGARSALKLLIQFEDTTPVPKRLPFEQRARIYIERHARAVFNEALRRAIDTQSGR